MTDNTELVKRYQDALKATGKARVLLYGADLDSAADALGDVEDFISELREELSRIRAETAKNSGEVVASSGCLCKDLELERGSLATQANSRAEAIRECIEVAKSWQETGEKIGQLEGATMAEDIASALRALLTEGEAR